MTIYCTVYGCFQNKKTNSTRRFFRFPSQESRCRRWVKAISRIDLESKSVTVLNKYYYVCDLHFEDSDVAGRYLKFNAVPTLMLPQLESLSSHEKQTQTDLQQETCLSCHLEIKAQYKKKITPGDSKSMQSKHKIQKLCASSSSDKMAQCDNSTASTSKSLQTPENLSTNTPRKRKLRLERKPEIKKRKLAKSQYDNLSAAKLSNIPPLLQKIIEIHKKLQRNSHGNRYDQEYLMFALNIFFSSPNAYRVLSEILCLPSKRTLQGRLALGLSTKFDENVINCLKIKVKSMSDSEKYCIISADEMPLKRHLYYQIDKDKVIGFHEIDGQQTKEIASRSIVVMARGVFSEWKQPLAYCFLSQNKNYAELSTWLENIIAEMIKIGFNVLAFTSDQGSKFINMANNKGVTTDKPYFFIEGKKIYYIFDVPHLLVSLRNNLINYDFVYHDTDGSEHVASWKDIENLNEIEKNKKYKMAFKLTESHIKPNNFEKMHVKYATQVLSRTVAVSMFTFIENKKLPDKSIGTAKFVELINDTFDILNSSAVKDDYKFKRAFHQADFQMETLERAQHILSGLQVIDRQNGEKITRTIKFISGFLISVKSLLNIASDLKNAGYKYLFTRRFNQDVLGNFFGKVRQQSGNCREPSPIKFFTAFRKHFVMNLLGISENTNCSKDEELDHLLVKIEEAQCSLSLAEKRTTNSSNRTSVEIGTSDHKFELPEEKAFTYVCGYLLRKCYERHGDCEIMKMYVEEYQKEDEKNTFTFFKAYIGTLINPPENFKLYIRQINDICEDYLRSNDLDHIGHDMLAKINETMFEQPCPCFPLDYLKKLFVRFRIFNLLKQNNKNFRDKTFTRKYFDVSHL